MTDYIARAFANDKLIDGTTLEGRDLEEAVNAICAVPAADVRPVVRGHWIFDRGDLATCSNCGSEILKRDVRNHRFCHYCGADMRKKVKHDRDL